MATTSERLVDLASQIRFENLPLDVVREAGRRLLDASGCAIAGATGSTTEQVCKTALRLGGAPECTVLGTSESTSCE